MRAYNSSKSIPPALTQTPKFTPITASTKLVGLKGAAEAIAAERGLELSVKTIREYCRSRKWKEAYHWVKPSKQYLINLTAVYEWIAFGGK